MLNAARYLLSLSAILCLLFFMSCGSDGLTPPRSDVAYFPLRVGDYRIYRIHETQITPYNVETVFEYQIKSVVTDSFMNGAATYSFIMARFKRNTSTDAWQNFDTWTARVSATEAVVTEGNVPYLKIVFPAQTGREWNGNTYNNEVSNEFCGGNSVSSCDLYTYGSVRSPFTTSGGMTFDNTIEVIENNNSDLIVEQNIQKEIYAWEIGLVNREVTLLKYCTVGSCSGDQMVEEGLLYKQQLIEYGHQ